jgi:hypothetical protein
MIKRVSASKSNSNAIRTFGREGEGQFPSSPICMRTNQAAPAAMLLARSRIEAAWEFRWLDFAARQMLDWIMLRAGSFPWCAAGGNRLAFWPGFSREAPSFTVVENTVVGNAVAENAVL